MKDIKSLLQNLGLTMADLCGERTRYGCSETSNQTQPHETPAGIHALLPYRSFDPETGFFQNEVGLGGRGSPSVGFVLEVAPMVGSTEAMQREISALFQNVLPEGSNLQFLLWADPRIDPLLDAWSNARQGKSFYEALPIMAQKRASFIKGKIFEDVHQSTLFRNFRVIVSYSQDGTLENPVDRQKLLNLKDQIQKAFETLGCPVRLWTAHDALRTLDGLLNFNESTSSSDIAWNPYDSLESQIPAPGVAYHLDKHHIKIETSDTQKPYGIKMFSLRQTPNHWALYAMGELIGDMHRDLLRLPCPFMLHYGIHIVRQQSTSTKIQSRQSWVESQARSKIGKRFPILIQQAKELDFVRFQTSKGERFVETAFSAGLFSPMETMVQNEQILLSLFRSKRWQLTPDPYIQLPLFLSTLPMNWGAGVVNELKKLKRLKTTLSTESANMLPIQGEWKGTISPCMLLTGRRGQVFTWSPFDNETGNYNVVVVGRSGSGKSVFMQELMISILGQGGRVYALDVGRSFEKTAKLLGGTFIEFTTRSPISLNPFSSIPEEETEAQDALAMLKPVVALMAAPREGTTDLENAAIEKALLETWKLHGKNASMTDVAHFLGARKDAISQTLSQKLFPYTKDGIYGRFFEGSATVDLNAPFVVMEMEELKERKDLQSVIVQMMILGITNRLYLGNRTQPTALVLDEAWDMLRGNQSGVFIETAARRLRKYKGSLVVGTQSINDFYATPGAQATFDNSDWMCLLSQKAESIAQLKKTDRIMMDGPMETFLNSLKTEQGQYAEVMIYGPHGYAIARLVLDPFSIILYSTKAEEYAEVKRMTGSGMKIEDAIEHVAQTRYAHVSKTRPKAQPKIEKVS